MVASSLEDDSFFYVSSESIRSSGKNLKTAWELVNYHGEVKQGYKSIKAQQEYDCVSNKVRMMYVSTHSELDGKGQIVHIAEKSKSQFKAIPNDSVASYTKGYICNSSLDK
jgi:hypothetical protein